MMNKRCIILFILGLLCLSGIILIVLNITEKKRQENPASTESTSLNQGDMEALELGRKVLAVKAAIENPDDPNSLEAIRDLGLDSRYYTMVRGWLSMELAGATSILEASGQNPNPEIKKRADFLKKAIRAIDLE